MPRKEERMLRIFLQIWGGLLYLLNKIFFSVVEKSEDDREKRQWRIATWVVYIVGLPAWIVIFVQERNWMAAAVEAGGAASMLLGLMNAIRGIEKNLKWLDWFARIIAVAGIGYSVYDFNGIRTWNQGLELGIVIGFLLGTYLLAQEKPIGYLWFALMNISAGPLMFIEHYPWLFGQQFVSLMFVLDAYYAARKKAIARPRTD